MARDRTRIVGMHNHRLALGALVLVALAQAAFFIGYQQPDWNTAWTDQGGYQMLARGILRTGEFTRYPDSPTFVAEVLRTPGYPIFVAAVFALFGDSHMAVAVVQAGVFAGLCLVAFALGREIGGPRVGLATATAVTLYPMFPYFGALVLTELWTTFVLTAGLCCCLIAVRTRKPAWFAAAGLLVGWTSLTRPGFFLLPAFMLLPALLDIREGAWRPRATGWLLFFAAFGLVMGPWFAYNVRHFGALTLSAAGDLGRPIWEASWQGRWDGRTQAALTRIADEAPSDAEATARVMQLAAEAGLDPAPMLEYIGQWQTIRRIWTTPTEPEARVRGRFESTREYRRVGFANIARDPIAYLRHRVVRALPVLWIGDVPIRYSDIDATPWWVIRGMWAVQAAIALLGLVGLWQVWRHRGTTLAVLVATPLVYVTAVHVPILAEARQSLPAKPLLLALAAAGVCGWWARRHPTSPETAGS